MPYENEHAARIESPDDFEPESFRTKVLPNGVRMILAQRSSDGAVSVQSYRFPTAAWTEAEAEQWLSDNDIDDYIFEPAVPMEKDSSDLYATAAEAVERANEIGCIGYHVHEADGSVVYMPCDTMTEYDYAMRRQGASLQYIEKAPQISAAVRQGLQNKVDAHNEKYGDNPKRRATLRMLSAVFRRGVGAYNTNPESVRPNVRSADQWAYARVNTFLRALGRDKYTSGRFDTDLLPEGHRFSTKVAKAEWTTAYVNDLPDSAFLYIMPGGEKDQDGKTVPRSARKLPYRDASGKVDLPHLRNALARLSQTDLSQATQDRIRRRASELLEQMRTRKAYEGIDFKPPQGVADAAELGLSLRREHGRGGTLVGVARARDLSNRTPVTPDTIKRMVSFFARHEVDLKAPSNSDRSDPGYPGAGRIAWLLWGGDPGRRWAEKIARQMAREDLSKAATEAGELMLLNAVSTPSIEQGGLGALRRMSIEQPATHIRVLPQGERFILEKTSERTCYRYLGAGDTPQAYEDTLKAALTALPRDTVIEAICGADGSVTASDVLFAGGVTVAGLDTGLRSAILKASTEGTGMDIVIGAQVDTAENMVLTAREMADADRASALELRDAAAPYEAPVTRLELEQHRRELWRYVPPRTSEAPKAIFVSGNPNATEGIRGTPLAGPDGATFRKSLPVTTRPPDG